MKNHNFVLKQSKGKKKKERKEGGIIPLLGF